MLKLACLLIFIIDCVKNVRHDKKSVDWEETSQNPACVQRSRDNYVNTRMT